jgi:hypothetical protein
MKVLHVLKSEPDKIIKILIEPLSEGNDTQQFALYKGVVDYDHLIKQVFEYDKVICWW